MSQDRTDARPPSDQERELQRRLETGETYGMILEGFQSTPGIPDTFCSAEDPAERARLWQERCACVDDIPDDVFADEDPADRGHLIAELRDRRARHWRSSD